MAIKLTPSKPDDRFARFHFRFVQGEDGSYSVDALSEDEASDATGWIDFWAEDAKSCRDALKRVSGRLYVLQERRDKRKNELTDDAAVAELEEYNRLLSEGLSYRTKGWRLVNSAGEEVDAPLTFENAKAVYSDDQHNLREQAQAFLNGRKVFPMRASENS